MTIDVIQRSFGDEGPIRGHNLLGSVTLLAAASG